MSDFFNEALKGGLDSLTADQLEELIIMAQAKRSESKNDKEVYDPNSCPHCGSIWAFIENEYKGQLYTPILISDRDKMRGSTFSQVEPFCVVRVAKTAHHPRTS